MFPRLFSMDSVTILGGSIPLSRHVIDDFRFLFYSLKKIRGTDPMIIRPRARSRH